MLIVRKPMKDFVGLENVDETIRKVKSNRQKTDLKLSEFIIKDNFEKGGKIDNNTVFIVLSKTKIEIKTKITDFKKINCVRIIPKLGYYVIEIIYTITDSAKLIDNKKYLSIDFENKIKEFLYEHLKVGHSSFNSSDFLWLNEIALRSDE